MQVSEVKVFPVGEEKLKAFVSIVFNDCFMVNDIKIIEGREGLFISMPSRRKKNGRFKDVAHPLNNETRQMIESQILHEYRNVVGDVGARVRPLNDPEEDPTADEVPQVASEAVAAVAAVDAIPSEAVVAVAADGADEGGERTLDEVAEAHLSESFWTT